MSIAAKDATGAALTLASTTTAAGEAPGSTPVDPTTGAPFKAADDATLASILAKIIAAPATAAAQDTGNSSLTSIDGKVATEVTLEAARLLLQALLDRTPAALGQQPASQSAPVSLSQEDAEQLAQLIDRLGVLQTARNVDGSLRVTLLGGTVTTIATVSAVTTLGNQTSVGGYTATPHIPALMNMTAFSNTDRMVG